MKCLIIATFYFVLLKLSLVKLLFRLFDSWMSKDGFDQIVFDSWSKFVGFGTPEAYFAAKLLKAELRKWRAKEYPRE